MYHPGIKGDQNHGHGIQPMEHRGVILLEDPDLAYYDHTGYASNQGRPTTVTMMSQSSHPVDYSSDSRFFQHRTPGVVPKAPPTVASTDTAATGYGALRPGGPVPLFSKHYVGYLLTWLLIGFFDGGIPALVYPLFGVYLHLEDYQGNAVLALINFAWNFKFIFSFLTDCVPMNRYRRKPYLYFGWIILFGFMLSVMFRGQVDPYMLNGEVVNPNAEADGPRYVVPLIAISFARILVVVPSEGMMVEYAHREGEMIRGRTQTITMIVRSIGQAAGILLVALGCNGPEYGGSFDQSIPLQILFAVWTVLCVAGVVVTWFLVPESQMPTSAQPIRSQMLRVWRIIQQRSTWQIMLFGFFQNAAMSLQFHQKDSFYRLRLSSDTRALNLADAVAMLGTIIGAFLMKQYWTNSSWRKVMLWSFCATVVIGLPIETLTTFKMLPHQSLYLVKDLFVAVGTALIILTRELVIIEITDPGHEATTYGFITTVHYLGKPFVTMLSNLFASDSTDLKKDSEETQWKSATYMWIVFLVRIIVMLAIVRLVPRQKRHALEVKLLGNPSLIVPLVLFLCVVLVFLVVVTSSFLAVIKDTSCLKIAGGRGC
ncbi:hypothetical protein Poli38472_008084 [Pythium oligandrum]|uniref:Transmembrane protein n=1 Tax=Pythium oligandrum TaxID=41045 RepID=A0A8K1CN63_PYTOL|nr:hypothetical protein Poli38472_008084 [Pythium oligandrum]|eukprot:TMW65442.1 hypothetical protein Poli38472_008084 [Pythium oligandrum]